MIVLHDFAGVSHNISALKTNPLWPERAQGIGRFYLQGRFMKLRKVLAVILLSLVVFAFPSCDFLSGMFGGGEAWEPGTPNEPVEPQTPPDTEDGNAYLGYPTSTSGSNVQLIKHNGYTLLYSYDDLIPLWVMWHLDADDLGTGREDAFDEDPTVPAEYAVGYSDYTNSGFDRGHMCPNADRSASAALADETFYMTNMVPQSPYNNQRCWKDFEEFLRGLVEAGDEIYIVAGPYGEGGYKTDGTLVHEIVADINGVDKGIRVPESVWKIALIIDEGSDDINRIENDIPDVIAVDMPNKSLAGTEWDDYICSVNDIEAKTGYDFFNVFTEDTENYLEAQEYQNFH